MPMPPSASRVVAALRHLFNSSETGDNDRALLERFVRSRDEEAFAELVGRHGPLVRGVCRRLLRDAGTAEDVFQATFLVLARKAHRGGWRDSVGPWLHAVAVRLCHKARASHRNTLTVDPRNLAGIYSEEQGAPARLEWEEVKGVLDEELA